MDGLQEILRVAGAEDRARDLFKNAVHKLNLLTDQTDPKIVEGWFEETKHGKLYAVRTSCFKNWFSAPEEERAALRWLHRTQLLKTKDGAKPDFPNMEWAVTFPKVEGKGQRCYQFWDPGKVPANRKR